MKKRNFCCQNHFNRFNTVGLHRNSLFNSFINLYQNKYFLTRTHACAHAHTHTHTHTRCCYCIKMLVTEPSYLHEEKTRHNNLRPLTRKHGQWPSRVTAQPQFEFIGFCTGYSYSIFYFFKLAHVNENMLLHTV